MSNKLRDVYDMSYNEFSSLSVKDLRKVVSRLSSAANKRIKRLENAELVSPALLEVKESGGKFGTKGKSEEALKAEFFRLKNFFKAESSTVKGARSLEKNAKEVIKNVYGVDLDDTEYKKILSGYYDGYNIDNQYQAQKLRYGVLYKTFGVDPKSEESNNIINLSQRIIQLLDRYLLPGGMGYDGFAQFFDIE